MYGARGIHHTVLVPHSSLFEIYIPFPVQPELGHHGHCYDQRGGACLPDPEPSSPSAVVNHFWGRRQRPIRICDLLFHAGLPFFKIYLPHVTRTARGTFGSALFKFVGSAVRATLHIDRVKKRGRYQMNSFRLDSKNKKILSLVLVMTGLLSILYYIYDLIYPNHFVADMYGLEVMFRVSIVVIISLPLFIGLLLTVIGRKKKNDTLTKIGLFLANICSIVLILLSINVYFSRHKDEIRKTYPQKTTDELIRIALNKKDQYAIYEIIARKDSSAVPALCQILLDENQDGKLRIESAHALGQIGGDIARDALKKALTRSKKNSFLTDTIKYAIEDIERNKSREGR